MSHAIKVRSSDPSDYSTIRPGGQLKAVPDAAAGTHPGTPGDETTTAWASFEAYQASKEWPRRNRRAHLSRIMVGLDLAAIILACLVAMGHQLYTSAGSELTEAVRTSVILGAIIAPLWSALLRSRSLYDAELHRERRTVAKRVLEASIVAFAIPAFVDAAFSLGIMVSYVLVGLPLGLLGLWINHLVLHDLLRRRMLGSTGARILLFLNSQQYAQRDMDQWSGLSSHSDIVGFYLVDQPCRGIVDCQGTTMAPAGTTIDQQLLARLDVDAVVVMCPGDVPENWVRQMSWACAPQGVSVHIFPSSVVASPERVRASHIFRVPTMKVLAPGNINATGIVKRTFDIVITSLVLLAAAPIMLATALAIKLDDGGPIFYRQTRVGRNGTEFGMWKFRSMIVDADAQVEALRKQHNITENLFKMENDPRITRVGRFIRRYSIDELPQLFNVVTGEMSLVGPRPPLPREVVNYDDDAWMRMTVPPGMTGLWQVSGRSRLTSKEALSLDLLYTENWTMALDLSILVRTFKAVVGRDGAY
ncbi:sugar transferase [Corynebacterium uterequi]|uniref:Exopolysaccharide biosynthesis polyprenyl glycosylphosphotransferase n=1 Tax=Corynebacterium uterequi TaxID=1072256 RepID=A0A0G3HL99_9CORY|nr:sugar transferase [Corynebacterium uterequi]AKK11892.1 exopolysaccharide biosynthesis polyprenyl glycosylphosphotransferase [Corynebacterium uterequi]